MKRTKYAIGLDYGTESVRALLIDLKTAEERAVAVATYPHGVSSPFPDFALQHPEDYLECGQRVLKEVASQINASDIVGIGVDFTACTMFPVDKKGEPLSFQEKFKNNPHALVKLWKHHGAQEEADKINALALKRKEKFLDYYGGIISCEWMLPKVYETLQKAPEVFNETHFFVDAGDWIVFKLTGKWFRSTTFAGYKGLWSKEHGYPSKDFLKALDPQLEKVAEKWIAPVVAPGTLAGNVLPSVALEIGLSSETSVSVATIDAHSGVPGMGVYQDRSACLIMGTSTCHMFLSGELRPFKGMAGAVSDGIIPGLVGYESGQAAVGDLFAWFVKTFLPNQNSDISFENISKDAYALKPGSHGLLALDWNNGNRSILMNNHLTGMILGLDLTTRPYEVFRALVEATAFGTKKIIETYESQGIPVEKVVVCGGLSQLSDVMQIYCDILERPIEVAQSHQAVALGAAIFGALAAGKAKGGFDHIEDAVIGMTKKSDTLYQPNQEYFETYRLLYSQYQKVHDFFGVSHPEIMHTLKNFKSKN